MGLTYFNVGNREKAFGSKREKKEKRKKKKEKREKREKREKKLIDRPGRNAFISLRDLVTPPASQLIIDLFYMIQRMQQIQLAFRKFTSHRHTCGQLIALVPPNIKRHHGVRRDCLADNKPAVGSSQSSLFIDSVVSVPTIRLLIRDASGSARSS